jgi:hypothetical protein
MDSTGVAPTDRGTRIIFRNTSTVPHGRMQRKDVGKTIVKTEPTELRLVERTSSGRIVRTERVSHDRYLGTPYLLRDIDRDGMVVREIPKSWWQWIFGGRCIRIEHPYLDGWSYVSSYSSEERTK